MVKQVTAPLPPSERKRGGHEVQEHPPPLPPPENPELLGTSRSTSMPSPEARAYTDPERPDLSVLDRRPLQVNGGCHSRIPRKSVQPPSGSHLEKTGQLGNPNPLEKSRVMHGKTELPRWRSVVRTPVGRILRKVHPAPNERMKSDDSSARNGPSRASRHRGTGVAWRSSTSEDREATGAHSMSCNKRPSTEGKGETGRITSAVISELTSTTGDTSTPTSGGHTAKRDCSLLTLQSSNGQENCENPSGGGRMLGTASEEPIVSPMGTITLSSATTDTSCVGVPRSGEHTDGDTPPTL